MVSPTARRHARRRNPAVFRCVVGAILSVTETERTTAGNLRAAGAFFFGTFFPLDTSLPRPQGTVPCGRGGLVSNQPAASILSTSSGFCASFLVRGHRPC